MPSSNDSSNSRHGDDGRAVRDGEETLTESTRERDERQKLRPMCPFVASYWDRWVQHSYATDENLCYATSRTTRFLLVLRRRVLGGAIGVSHQRRYCYGDYPTCPHYVRQLEHDMVKEES